MGRKQADELRMCSIEPGGVQCVWAQALTVIKEACMRAQMEPNDHQNLAWTWSVRSEKHVSFELHTIHWSPVYVCTHTRESECSCCFLSLSLPSCTDHLMASWFFNANESRKWYIRWGRLLQQCIWLLFVRVWLLFFFLVEGGPFTSHTGSL